MLADGMGGAQAGEVASQTAAKVFSAGARRGRHARGAARPGSPSEANRQIYELAQADEAQAGHGHDAHRGAGGGRRRDRRARRRQPRLPAARRRARAAHPRPLAGGRAGAQRARSRPRTPNTTRRSRSSRARSGPSPTSRWTPTPTRPPGRRVPDVLGRAHRHDLRRRDRGDPARRATSLEEAAEALVRAANQSGGQGQHHRRAVLARGGRGRAGGRRPSSRGRRSSRA